MLMCSKIKTKELSKTLRQAAQRAFADYPVISAYLYGSQVGDRNLSTSDIDVAVYIDPATLDGLFLNLKNYVTELKRLSCTPREDFLSNPDKVGSAKYHLLVAIESV
ncbi:MAG: hypothetical protein DDT19_01430 [Syntrophomonadaceae bacterium]|nr:hypothetical protein [Bacillota bacterium]